MADERVDVRAALTPDVLARAGASVGRLHHLLMGAGLTVDAYTAALADIHAYVAAHPEQVDVVRLLGGDEQDLVTALVTQWFERQKPQQETGQQARQVVTHDGSTSDDAERPAIISLASRRRAGRTRKQSR